MLVFLKLLLLLPSLDASFESINKRLLIRCGNLNEG